MKRKSNRTSLPAASTRLLFTAVPSLASALYRQLSPAQIFARLDSTCGQSSYKQCSQPGLPHNFCCPVGNTCVVLAGNTTALCCPEGNDCRALRAIPCDISFQDKGQHPESVIMTTALSAVLPQCRDMCCPFGYSCDQGKASNGPICTINPDQTAKPTTAASQSSPSTTTPPATKSSQAVGVTTVSPLSASATTKSDAESARATPTQSHASSPSAASPPPSPGSATSEPKNPDRPSTPLVAGSVLGGVAAAALIGMVAWVSMKGAKRTKNEAQKQPQQLRSSSFGNIIKNPMTSSSSGAPIISKPIFAEAAIRSDFVRKVKPENRSCQHGSFRYSHDEDGEYERESDTSGDRPVSAAGMDGLHSVRQPPPRITTPGAVSFMHAKQQDWLDPRNSAYQAPLSLPSSRHLHGQENGVSVAAGRRIVPGSLNPDSDMPLAPPGAHAGNRMTTFADFIKEAHRGRS